MSRGVPFFFVIVGAPGAGKSSEIEFLLRGKLPFARRLIFDIEHEFGKLGTIASLETIRKGILAAGERGPFSYVYQPAEGVDLKAQFGKFCRLAFAAEDVLLVVDELADVDSPSPYAVVPAFARLLRRGRKRGVRFLAATQQPADMNKRLWRFATVLWVGFLGGDNTDLARELRVDRGELAALRPGDFIALERFEGRTVRGRIAWQGGRPVHLPRGEPGAPAAIPASRRLKKLDAADPRQ